MFSSIYVNEPFTYAYTILAFTYSQLWVSKSSRFPLFLTEYTQNCSTPTITRVRITSPQILFEFWFKANDVLVCDDATSALKMETV